MPYIKHTERDWARGNITAPEGDFAYHLTLDYLKWLDTKGKRRFKHFASLVGIVILSLLELWWRVIRPYEDKKKKENGDVFQSE